MIKHFRVIVVGAGFGGLQAAQSLSNSSAEILLIDRNNYHTFVPLLYQVATGQIEPEQIAYPARTILRRSRHVQFLMAEVEQVDFSAQMVQTNSTTFTYDFLVLATGSRTQYMGVPGAPESAFAMRTLTEAVALRNHLFVCFERAAQENDLGLRQQLLTFVIVGGGATGLEMAGALVEMLRGCWRQDHPSLVKQTRLVLVQSGDRLLTELPHKLGTYAYRRLCKIGVEVFLQEKVSQVSPEAVHFQNGLAISTKTVIWTAGLEANVPTTSEDLSKSRKGKLLVRSTLQLLEHSNVYAIGDLADVEQSQALNGVAPEALQQGVAVARNIKRQLKGRSPQPFSYLNKGRLAIIGCYSGVGKIGSFSFTGVLAWFMWLMVHVVYLPGYRSRLIVLLTWVQTYVLGDRAVRSILVANPSKRHQYSLPKPQLDFLPKSN